MSSYIQEPKLSYLQKDQLEVIKKGIGKEVFWFPALEKIIKDNFLKNKANVDAETSGWGDDYYHALFSAILSIEKHSVVSIETILKSINLKNKAYLFFFARYILAEKNPVSIIDSPTKRLMVSLVKKGK